MKHHLPIPLLLTCSKKKTLAVYKVSLPDLVGGDEIYRPTRGTQKGDIMDYQKQYDLLITKHGKQIKPDTGYYECHHVIPTSLGGKNTKENKQYLSAKAHYIAHYLLYKIHGNGPMATAFWAMSSMDKHGYRQKPNARSFETARTAMANKNSGTTHPFYGRELTPEHKLKLSAKNQGRNNSQAKPANIYCYKTNEMLAHDILITAYCKDLHYTAQGVAATARGIYPQHKGIYAVYI